jgi:type II secretory pathway component PulM
VLEVAPSAETAAALQPAATLAGPVLARIAAVERYRHTAERLDRQRDLLTDIINSLPDPIVIAGAPPAHGTGEETVVQNRRAAHLFLARAGDTDGRQRAVDINAMLFAAHLATSAGPPAPTDDTPRNTDGGSRDLTLVDPLDGADLLFEASEHALSAGAARAALHMTVLRDVTELRRAAGRAGASGAPRAARRVRGHARA